MPQYQGIWSLQSAAQLQSTQRWVTDPSFDYTTLLLQADNAANGAQNNTFIDSSSNNFTITRNGNATQGTFTPYSLQPGAWSNFFSSGQSNYIQTPATVPSITGDYTAEAWVYITSLPNVGVIFSLNASEFELWVNTNNTVSYYTGGSIRITTNATVSLNVWTHIALVRSSGVAKIYINGVADSSTYNSSATIGSGTAFLYFGRDGGVSGGFNGYISNARLAIGASVYTSNFTPSPAPLGATSGGQNPPTGTQTYVLTCQSNRFIDNSASPVTLTITGTPSVQAFSPFAPQYQYTPSVTGGSGYFDGTTDYLTLPYSSQLQFTGNFTIEFWAYPLTQVTSFSGVFNNYSSWPSSTGVAIFCGHSSVSSTKWCVALFGTFPAITSTNDYIRNAWSHVALVRNGTGSNNITLYVNGVASGTTTSNNTVTGTADNWWIGTTGDAVSTQTFTGYLSGFRAINSAEYTANFTPPAAPLTAGSNKLLLNFTNAGIYDGTLKNNLETVGNAQVSTSVVKYGTGSMYFDGNGDYLVSRPATTDLYAFGTGDFTVEMWLYMTTAPSANAYTLYDSRPASTNGNYLNWFIDTSSKLGVYINSSTIYTATGTISTNTWTHIAVSRSGTSLRVFINGTQDGSTVTNSTSLLNGANRPVIAQQGFDPVGGTNWFPGYIDDLRVTKGIARYTANFTPPTVALPRQ